MVAPVTVSEKDLRTLLGMVSDDRSSPALQLNETELNETEPCGCAGRRVCH